MDEQQLQSALETFKTGLLAEIDDRFNGFEQQAQKTQKQAEWERILSEAKQLGYDFEDPAEAWRARMLLDVAGRETNGDLQRAHVLMGERGVAAKLDGGDQINSGELATPPIQLSNGTQSTAGPAAGQDPPPVQPVQPARPGVVMESAQPRDDVPPTGALVGGSGIPEMEGDPIANFDGAADATLELLTQVGNPGE